MKNKKKGLERGTKKQWKDKGSRVNKKKKREREGERERERKKGRKSEKDVEYSGYFFIYKSEKRIERARISRRYEKVWHSLQTNIIIGQKR